MMISNLILNVPKIPFHYISNPSCLLKTGGFRFEMLELFQPHLAAKVALMSGQPIVSK